MTDAADTTALTAGQRKEVQTAAARLRQFASAHGGAQYVFVEHVTANRTRVVVVGEDGAFGDQVLTSYEAAQEVCAQCGFEVLEGEWEREAVGSVRTSGFEWGLMGRGRPAGQ